jgi:membrane protein
MMTTEPLPLNKQSSKSGTLSKSGADRLVPLVHAKWHATWRAVGKIAVLTWNNLLDDDLTGRSAQLAYYFFLSLFPGLIFISSLIGLIAGSQSHFRDHLLDSFGTFLPPSAYTLVVGTFTEVVKSSTAGKAALGILFAFWSATSGMSAVQDTLNGVFRLKETRPLWKSTLVAMALTVVVLSLILMAVGAFFYGGPIVEFLAARIGLNAGMTFIWKLLQWPIAIFLLSFAFAITYQFAPDVKQHKWEWMTPGSAIGILGWLLVSAVFRLYLHFFNRYSLTYGSLGAVIILLLWFYFSGFMLLLGAELNTTINRLGIAACGLPVKRPEAIATEVSIAPTT